MTNIAISTWLYYSVTIIDILIVAQIIYTLLNFFIPQNLFPSVILMTIFIVFVFISQIFKMQLTLWLIQKLLFVLPFAILILFQQEIKQFLTHRLGHSMKRLFINDNISQELMEQEEILDALTKLSEKKIGAIIAIENTSNLSIIKSKAVNINADISSALLLSIFHTKSPLHDGAVIIDKNKIAVASAFFPLTDKENVMNLGSRHRAAIGITETTDVITLIVSEQTGAISYCKAGFLFYNVGIHAIKEILNNQNINIEELYEQSSI